MTSVDVVWFVSLACTVAAALGWSQGYHSITSYVTFWLTGILVGLSAVRIERLGFRSATRTDRIIRTVVIGFALIVLCGLLLGSAGWIGRAAYLVFFGICFVVSLIVRLPRESLSPIAGRTPGSRTVFAIAAPILVFIVTVGIGHLPIRYDSLNYHLYFPAQWLQAGRISIVPTPFGDEAPAYAPSNSELYFLWLMLPFHGDLLARIGQFPFYLLTALAQYALARRVGARPEHAIYPAAFFLLARPIVEEAVGADVDLIFTALFVCAVYLGFIAAQTNGRNDWIVWGTSVGLCCGTKYVSLVYVPVLLLIALMRGLRLRALWTLPGVAVLALPWYVRNWTVAGSPIYPSSLTLAGRTLARGAFSHGAMVNSLFHVSDFRLFAVVAGHAFGTSLLLLWIPFAAIGTVTLITKFASWPARFLVLLPAAMVPLFWFGVPDNTDSRFVFPIAALALLPLAFAFRDDTRWNRRIALLYGAGLLWLIVGVKATLAVRLATAPYYLRDWLSLRGLIATPFLPLFVACALAAGWSRELLSRGQPRRRTALLFSAACILVGAGSQAACPGGGCDFLDLTPSYIRATMIEGWDWVRLHAHGQTIAYTGNNIPYPLFGERLTNRVHYVNIDHHLEWKLHDYDRARRRRGDEAESEALLLATSSGVLTPVSRDAGSATDAVRPRFERMRGYRDAWLHNLNARGVTLLFVSSLSAYEIDNVWHDAAGFPIESEWAQADPGAFHLIYENRQVRIYSVSLPAKPDA
jgi:4-amino-4-deoxy-L-arabinose transferase-like glycosyltransferase